MGMRVGGAASGAAAAAWQKQAASAPAASPAPATAAAAQDTAVKQVQADMQSLATGSKFSIHA